MSEDLSACGLQTLVELDELRASSIGGRSVLIHKDHRWLLPLIHSSQVHGRLPTPCNLAMFDAHHDALEPHCLDRIRSLREAGFTIEELIELCNRDLRILDDDWLQAAMYLGLIRDAVLFGVHDVGCVNFPMMFVDSAGERHRIEVMGLPGRQLGYQGHLSDLAKGRAYEHAWQILGWECQSSGYFRFADDAPKIALDFDLDCFAVPWREYVFPWPDEVFEAEFIKPSTYSTTEGMSGQTFVLGLAQKGGLITIATEPRHCGGVEKAAHILDRFSHYVLDSPPRS